MNHEKRETPEEFLTDIRKMSPAFIARFLDKSENEVRALDTQNQLTDALSETYAQMPIDDLLKFELEMFDAPETQPKDEWNNGEPFWAEVVADHHDETDGFIVAYVDAYKTGDDDNEDEGVVIANVVGAMIHGQPRTTVLHRVVEAQVDPTAKAVIEEAIKDVTEALNETAPSELRRVRTVIGDQNESNGQTITIQIVHFEGSNDGTVVAEINHIRGTADGQPYKGKPKVQLHDGLVLDLKTRVEALVAETVSELTAE